MLRLRRGSRPFSTTHRQHALTPASDEKVARQPARIEVGKCDVRAPSATVVGRSSSSNTISAVNRVASGCRQGPCSKSEDPFPAARGLCRLDRFQDLSAALRTTIFPKSGDSAVFGGCPDVSRSCGGAPSIRLSSATRRTASVAPALLLEHHKIKTGAQSTQWSRFPANWSGVETRRGSVFTSSDPHALAPRRRKRKSDQASTPYRLVELQSYTANVRATRLAAGPAENAGSRAKSPSSPCARAIAGGPRCHGRR